MRTCRVPFSARLTSCGIARVKTRKIPPYCPKAWFGWWNWVIHETELNQLPGWSDMGSWVGSVGRRANDFYSGAVA